MIDAVCKAHEYCAACKILRESDRYELTQRAEAAEQALENMRQSRERVRRDVKKMVGLADRYRKALEEITTIGHRQTLSDAVEIAEQALAALAGTDDGTPEGGEGV